MDHMFVGGILGILVSAGLVAVFTAIAEREEPAQVKARIDEALERALRAVKSRTHER